jgi:hypothetical protein
MSGAAPFGVKGADFDFLFPPALATKFASNRLSDEGSRPERVRLNGQVEHSDPVEKDLTLSPSPEFTPITYRGDLLH